MDLLWNSYDLYCFGRKSCASITGTNPRQNRGLSAKLVRNCREPMSSSGHLPPRIRFGVFEVDVRSGELLKDGEKIPLQGQPFALLSMLLEHPGELVTREELRQRIWPEETFVDFDLALNTAVKKVRAAVGDSAEKPQFIETLPKRGYRFIGRLDPAIVAAPRVDTRHPSTSGRLTIGIRAGALP